MLYECSKDSFLKQLRSQLDKEEANKLVKELPDFRRRYEVWYSESLSAVKQLLPARLANFISFYESPKLRKEITYGNYTIQDYMKGLTVSQHGDVKVSPTAAIPQFRQQLAILDATNRRFESSLFEIAQLA